MLTINGVSYNKYLTACTVSQVTRSETVINTLAGTQYPYGTGKGYEAAMTLSLVPTDIVRILTHAIAGAGTTFTASFWAAERRLLTVPVGRLTCPQRCKTWLTADTGRCQPPSLL